MKLFKKVISLLLIISLLPFTAYAEEEAVRHNEEACKFLTALGLIDDTFEFQFGKEISRMEFARVVLKAGGYSSEGYTYKGVFQDVAEDNEYAADIEMLYELGIVSGDGTSFAPARSVTATEAVIMLLRMAGYTEIVNANGGYPDGYLKVARSEGLLKNVPSLDRFVGDDMVVMVYNMLMLKTVSFSKPGSFTFDDTETVLSQRHSVYFRKGVVVENGISAISSKSTVKKDEVCIDSGDEKVVMSVGNTDIGTRLGYKVSAYYKYDKTDDRSECIYYEYESRNSIEVIDISDIESFSASRIEYNAGTRTKKLEITGAAIIYNGAYYKGAMPDISSLYGKVGNITAIDNNDDSIYDTVSIEAYDTYLVGNAVAGEYFVFDKTTGEKVDLREDDADFYELRMADGKDAVFGDICENVVLSVAMSAPAADAKTVRAILSTDRASGALTSSYSEDGKNFIVLDGVAEYRILDRVTELPTAGSGVTLLLDAFGNVCSIETSFLSDTQYGFMVNCKRPSRADGITVELLTRDGKLEKLPVAEKVTIDGTVYKNYQGAEDYISSITNHPVAGGIMPKGVMPVRYRLSEGGEIRMLDTPEKGVDEDDNSLLLMAANKNVYSASTFGYAVPINGDTTILRITTPDNTKKDYYEEANRYEFVGASVFRERRLYTYNAYRVDPKSEYADFLIYFSSNGFDYDTSLTVVGKCDAKVYDEENGETYTVFKGISAGRSVESYIAKDYEDEFMSLGLKQGDVVRCVYDDNGRLSDVDGPIFSYDSALRQIKAGTSGDSTNDTVKIKNQETSAFVLMGDVTMRKEGLIRLYHLVWGTNYSALTSASAIKGDSERETFLMKIDGTVPITVYDVTKGKDAVYSGTYDDIVAMDNDFARHSVVVLRFRSNALQEAVVINNMYK